MILDINRHNETHMKMDVAASSGDFHTGLAAAVCVTVMSELGDKSFIMSAILAMHHSRSLTFLGTMLGHLIMTTIAVVLGMAASIIPEVYTKWASCICMTFFGLKMLKEGFGMPEEEEEEINQNEKLKIFYAKSEKCDKIDKLIDNKDTIDNNFKEQIEGISLDDKTQNGSSKQNSRRNSTDGVLMQAFTLSFLGEWGDRSQIATILLASTENPYGVAVGSFLGHVICTLAAVVGGRLIGKKFPVKTMTQVGGVVFLLFAASSLIFE
ncbi:transmembrane protein 165-like isoform X2 [Macrosteles quadrilineatus]|uniref:transmembrane protein 165-like isoform X2 n=1 Tax=Macrosteles quadrilineatus TaxID=74068 RepID=UPI0023E306C3|nr:transmembrane protein 165-like isoform X2 [Macrosteles quadrilineatus]